MSVRLNKTIEGPAVGRRLSSLRPRKQEENQRPGFAFAEEDGDCHSRTVQSNSTNNDAYFSSYSILEQVMCHELVSIAKYYLSNPRALPQLACGMFKN